MEGHASVHGAEENSWRDDLVYILWLTGLFQQLRFRTELPVEKQIFLSPLQHGV